MALLEREYAYEKETYAVDKRVINLLSDMGFIIADQDSPPSKFHRLIKQTDQHLIIITYVVRKRIINQPDYLNDPDLSKKIGSNSFGKFLKQAGLMPPDMQTKEYDEEEILKEEIEGSKPLFQDKQDHKEDKTPFQITLIDKQNRAMSIDCVVSEGQILFNKVRVHKDDGIQQSQRTWLDKSFDRQREYKGPKFDQLSEPVQNSLVQYLYERGVHPEIAICIEYLSWNKEQRIYMSWLSSMFFYFYQANEMLKQLFLQKNTNNK